jgi:hypothetical protein
LQQHSQAQASKVQARFSDNLPRRSFWASRAITIVKVKNFGPALQKNVTLRVGGADYFVIDENKKIRYELKKEQIKLGDMQAHSEIEISCWGNPFRERGWLRVVSHEGLGTVKFIPSETEEQMGKRFFWKGVRETALNVLLAACVGLVIVWIGTWLLNTLAHHP